MGREASLHSKDILLMRADFLPSKEVFLPSREASLRNTEASLHSKVDFLLNRAVSLLRKEASLPSSSLVSLPKPPMDLDQLSQLMVRRLPKALNQKPLRPVWPGMLHKLNKWNANTWNKVFN